MIWLIGAKGMLGTDLANALRDKNIDFTGTDKDIDITDFELLLKFAADKQIHWIVNASAYTAVDKAEDEFETASLINETGVNNIAKIASILNIPIIHFSTDYVFDGRKQEPYNELDAPCPISAYGKSKHAGEKSLIETTTKFFIFRISWLYGLHGANFVKTMLRLMNEKPELKVVSDQKGSPTYTKTLAVNIVSLIEANSNKYGIYHYADDGIISWYEFASKIYDFALSRNLLNKNVNIKAIETKDYPTKAARPLCSAFDKTKVHQALGFNINNWEENLSDFINEMVKHERV